MEKLKQKIENALVKHYTDRLNQYMEENGLTIDDIRERLYNNLEPWAYSTNPRDSARRVFWAISHSPDYKRQEPGWSGTDDDRVFYSQARDDIWAEYLNIPKNKRHTTDNRENPLNPYKVIPSKYTPTITDTPQRQNYKTLENLFGDKNEIFTDLFVEYGMQLPEGKNMVGNAYANHFGDHTIGKGFDENGQYLSVYDLWDVSPISGYGEDESAGIGTPIHFYDRLYLDDYFGLDDTIEGGVKGTHWLPSPVVTAKYNKKKNISTYKKGSKIHIKKENRGKFTAAANRAGMGVQEYANKVLRDPNASPQLKKRANFARNAKKWKHGN